jgi:alpha-beta hydrolase superfamily lysophospholipase
MTSRRAARVGRWLVRGVGAAVLAVVLLVVGGAIQSMLALPDLRPWHRFAPRGELTAGAMDERFTLEQYLAREAIVFAEVHDRVEQAVIAEGNTGTVANRYDPASISAPARASRDWNRTFEMTPPTIRGGALLIHGLTDSPYSMRALAERLTTRGVYVLALRMPGHGTVPAGLTTATREDWLAAGRVGLRHVRRVIGANRPLLLVGYSNGGALVMQLALESLTNAQLPAPAGVVLLSPMIGVSPMARLARVISALGPVPFFEKARWLDVVPEYNPFKYNSFPAGAAQQSYRVASTLTAGIADARASGALARLPPVLAFQSIVDATVSTQAVVRDLFDQLPGGSHELVVFDINRHAGLDPYIRPADKALVASLAAGGPRAYRRTLVTNVSAETLDVGTRTVAPHSSDIVEAPIGLAWPAQVFSLSHVALPFPADDPLYGIDAPVSASGAVALGRLSPRGEKSVLTVPVETLMRIGWNPFFPFMARRIDGWVDTILAVPPR